MHEYLDQFGYPNSTIFDHIRPIPVEMIVFCNHRCHRSGGDKGNELIDPRTTCVTDLNSGKQKKWREGSKIRRFLAACPAEKHIAQGRQLGWCQVDLGLDLASET